MAARDHFGSEWTEPWVRSPDYEADVTLREEALTRYLGPAPAWYRACFASDRPNDWGSGVDFQVAGEGWRTSPTWPPPRTRRVRLHLEHGGELARQGGRARSASIPYEPEDPVPSLDENPWRVLFRQVDRSVLEHRADLVRFQTEPLAEPLVLAGPVAVAVTASARGGAGALHANLVDVWPGGSAHRLASGVATVERAPGRVRIDLGHASCRLEPGRSLRLELACSDFPRHPRTNGDASALTATFLRPGELRLRLGADATLAFHVVNP
jgi:putative CocE/NonD family hydrolase